MYRDVERFFLKGDNEVWINPRRLQAVVRKIPDVIVKTDHVYHNYVIIEVKRYPSELYEGIGQCLSFRDFAKELYIAMPDPIPDWVVQELRKAAPQIGLLSVDTIGNIKKIRAATPNEVINKRISEQVNLYLSTYSWVRRLRRRKH